MFSRHCVIYSLHKKTYRRRIVAAGLYIFTAIIVGVVEIRLKSFGWYILSLSLSLWDVCFLATTKLYIVAAINQLIKQLYRQSKQFSSRTHAMRYDFDYVGSVQPLVYVRVSVSISVSRANSESNKTEMDCVHIVKA